MVIGQFSLGDHPLSPCTELIIGSSICHTRDSISVLHTFVLFVGQRKVRPIVYVMSYSWRFSGRRWRSVHRTDIARLHYWCRLLHMHSETRRMCKKEHLLEDKNILLDLRS